MRDFNSPHFAIKEILYDKYALINQYRVIAIKFL